MAYTGMFLRHYLGQTPSSSDTGQGSGWTASPDIIPYGTSPAQDPVGTFTTPTGYQNAFSSTIYIPPPNQTLYNYIYVRGLNDTTGPLTARFWFYYAQSNMALWPQQWMSGSVLVNGVGLNYVQVSAATPNEIVVNNMPFQWNPPQLSDPNNQHYCMIAFAENPDPNTGQLSNPPQSPAPTGFFSTWDQLAQFVISTPNMAWRNTIDVPTNAPTWEQNTPIAGAPSGGQFYCGIQLNNMPTDGYFAFSVPGPDPQNTIVVNKTQITNSNANITVPVTWPSTFTSSTMTLSYWMGPTTPPQGASITPSVMIPTAQVAQFMPELARSLSEPRRPGLPFRFRQPQWFLAYDSPAMLNATYMQVHVIGSVPYRFVTPS